MAASASIATVMVGSSTVLKSEVLTISHLNITTITVIPDASTVSSESLHTAAVFATYEVDSRTFILSHIESSLSIFTTVVSPLKFISTSDNGFRVTTSTWRAPVGTIPLLSTRTLVGAGSSSSSTSYAAGQSTPSNTSRTKGTIAGVAVGAVLTVLFLVLVLFGLTRRRRRRVQKDSSTTPKNPHRTADSARKSSVYYNLPELRGELIGPITTMRHFKGAYAELPDPVPEVPHVSGKNSSSLQPATVMSRDQDHSSKTKIAISSAVVSPSKHETLSSSHPALCVNSSSPAAALAIGGHALDSSNQPRTHPEAGASFSKPVRREARASDDSLLPPRPNGSASLRHPAGELDAATQNNPGAYAQLKGLTPLSPSSELKTPSSMLSHLKAEQEALLARIQLAEERGRELEAMRQSTRR